MPRRLRIGYARAVRVSGDTGAYSLSGQTAGLSRAVRVSGDAGAYSLSGQTAGLSRTPNGSYDISARLAAFVARHKAYRVSEGQSNTSTFEGTMTLPTAPTITGGNTNVSTAGELSAALTSGNEITFTANITGSISLGTRTNMRINFNGFTLTRSSPGAVLDLGSAARIELIGTGLGTHLAGGCINGSGFSDVKFKGIGANTGYNATSFNVSNAIGGEFARLLIEGCSWSADSYCLYVEDGNGLIVANSEFIRLSSPTHSHAITRNIRCADSTVFLDSRFVAVDSNSQVRPQVQTIRQAVYNCQFEGGSGINILPSGVADSHCADLVLLDNDLYDCGTTIICPYEMNVPPVTVVTNMLTADGNTGYTNSLGGSQLTIDGGSTGPGFLIGDNPRVAVQSPPAWSRQ